MTNTEREAPAGTTLFMPVGHAESFVRFLLVPVVMVQGLRKCEGRRRSAQQGPQGPPAPEDRPGRPMAFPAHARIEGGIPITGAGIRASLRVVQFLMVNDILFTLPQVVFGRLPYRGTGPGPPIQRERDTEYLVSGCCRERRANHPQFTNQIQIYGFFFNV